jgi:hypothetical protein
MPSGIEGFPKDVEEATTRLKNCAITIPILKMLNDMAIENGYNRQIREGSDHRRYFFYGRSHIQSLQKHIRSTR